MQEESPQQTPVRNIKLAMTAVIIIISGLAYFVFGERTSNAEDPTTLGYVFAAVAVLTSINGVIHSQKARSGEPVAVMAAAMFEVVALLAFIYVSFLNTEASLGLMFGAALFSIAMIWLVVPGDSEVA